MKKVGLCTMQFSLGSEPVGHLCSNLVVAARLHRFKLLRRASADNTYYRSDAHFTYSNGAD